MGFRAATWPQLLCSARLSPWLPWQTPTPPHTRPWSSPSPATSRALARAAKATAGGVQAAVAVNLVASSFHCGGRGGRNGRDELRRLG